jgi:hypothetical protein
MSRQQVEAALDAHPVFKDFIMSQGMRSAYDVLQVAKASSARSSDIPDHLRGLLTHVPERVWDFNHVFSTVQGVFLALEGAEASAASMKIDFAVPRSLWGINAYRLSASAEERKNQVGLRDEVARQCALLSEDMDWIEATTMEDLVGLRQNHALDSLRFVFSAERATLQRCSDVDFEAAAREIIEKVKDAMESAEIRSVLAKRQAEASFESAQYGLMRNAVLGLAGACFGTVGTIVGLVGAFLFETKTVVDLYKAYDDLRKNRTVEAANRTPIMHMVEIRRRPLMQE